MHACTYARLFATNETKNENAGSTMTNITSNFYSSKVPKKNKKSSVSMGVNINWGEAVFIWRS